MKNNEITNEEAGLGIVGFMRKNAWAILLASVALVVMWTNLNQQVQAQQQSVVELRTEIKEVDSNYMELLQLLNEIKLQQATTNTKLDLLKESMDKHIAEK